MRSVGRERSERQLARAEDLKVAVNLGVHAGAVDHGTFLVDGVGRLELHFFQRERIADDIAGDALQVFSLVGLDAAAAVDIEAGLFPALEHAGAFGLQETLLAEEGDELGAEQLLHRVHAVFGKDEEAFVAQEEPVGHEQM